MSIHIDCSSTYLYLDIVGEVVNKPCLFLSPRVSYILLFTTFSIFKKLLHTTYIYLELYELHSIVNLIFFWCMFMTTFLTL